MPKNTHKSLKGTKSATFHGKFKSHKKSIDPNEVIKVKVALKEKNYTLKDLSGKSKAQRLKELNKKYGLSAIVQKRLKKELAKFNLKFKVLVPEMGLIDLEGKIKDFESFFKTELKHYSIKESLLHGEVEHFVKGHSGKLSVIEELLDVIEGVLGLNEVPHAPATAARKEDVHPAATGVPSKWFAEHYHFPLQYNGLGQKVAIIACGGGFKEADYNSYFKKTGVKPLPKLTSKSVMGVKNSPGTNRSYDYELATDVQVVGGVANGAEIMIYFTKNSLEGFATAVYEVINDSEGKPPVISYSWGSNESNYSTAELKVSERILEYAAVGHDATILCSTGDAGSTNNIDATQTKLNVEYPASSPYVTSCGGTMLELDKSGKIKDEVVWNSHYLYSIQTLNITGGGFSSKFKRPDYQKKLFKSENPRLYNSHRGIPDVAGLANVYINNYTYWIHFEKTDYMTGGTSAVAPLWAALITLINQGVGSPCGFLNPILYKWKGSDCFVQILKGNNDSTGIDPTKWAAGPIWNPCCGMGAPNGNKLLEAFKAHNMKFTRKKLRKSAKKAIKASRVKTKN